MVKRCPNLIKCKSERTKWDVSVCGVCPLCNSDDETRDKDQICDDGSLIRGAKACERNPRKDKTRTDADNDAIVARARATIGFKICIDDFSRYDVDQFYDRAEEALMKLVIGECGLDIDASVRCTTTGLDWSVVGKSDSELCDLLYLIKLVVDFTGIDIDTLRAINKCLANLDDIRYHIAAYFKGTTLNDALDADGDVRSDGIEVYEAEDAAASPATFVMYDADGEELLPEPYSTTADTGGDTTTSEKGRDASGVNGYSFIFAIIASFIAMIF